MKEHITKKNISIFVIGFFLLSLSIFYANNEISSRLESHNNLQNIARVYDNFKKGIYMNEDYNHLLQLQDDSKGINGKSLVFYYKSKSNCLNLFQEITPQYFDTREREYLHKNNPKPAKVCHTNYEFNQLNYIKIYE